MTAIGVLLLLRNVVPHLVCLLSIICVRTAFLSSACTISELHWGLADVLCVINALSRCTAVEECVFCQ